MPRWKVIPHYGTVSNNAGDEDKLFGRQGDAESGPLACLRLKLNHQVAFKWVFWVIKGDKMLLLTPSAHLWMVVRSLPDILEEDRSQLGFSLDTDIAVFKLLC